MTLEQQLLSLHERTQEQLRHFFQQRQQVLVFLHQLTQSRPYTIQHHADDLRKPLDQFLLALIDYTSLGHFQCYPLITQLLEKKQVHYQSLLCRLLKTTDAINAFYAKYEKTWHPESFELDLSYLAERLADRLQEEDALMQLCWCNQSAS